MKIMNRDVRLEKAEEEVFFETWLLLVGGKRRARNGVHLSAVGAGQGGRALENNITVTYKMLTNNNRRDGRTNFSLIDQLT